MVGLTPYNYTTSTMGNVVHITVLMVSSGLICLVNCCCLIIPYIYINEFFEATSQSTADLVCAMTVNYELPTALYYFKYSTVLPRYRF